MSGEILEDDDQLGPLLMAAVDKNIALQAKLERLKGALRLALRVVVAPSSDTIEADVATIRAALANAEGDGA